MRWFIASLFAATVTTIVLAPVSFAQRREQEGRGARGMQAIAVMQAIDTNGDGELSEAEIDAAADALAVLDKNQDGKITADELRPNPPRAGEGAGREGGERQGGGEDLFKRMMAYDKNQDGALSRDELPDRMKSLLDRADANKDGSLSQDELKKVVAQQAPPVPEGRGEFGERGVDLVGRLFEQYDKNQDGKIAGDEILAHMKDAVARMDIDGDKALDRTEVEVVARIFRVERREREGERQREDH